MRLLYVGGGPDHVRQLIFNINSTNAEKFRFNVNYGWVVSCLENL